MSLQDVPGSTHSAFPRRQHATYPFHRTFHVRRLLPHYHSLLNKHTIYIHTYTHTCCVFFFSSVSLSLSSSFCSTQKHIFVSLFFFAFAPYLASQANNLHLLHAHKHVSSRHSPRAAVQQHSLHSQHTTPSPASAPSPSNLTLTLKIPNPSTSGNDIQRSITT